MFKRLLVAVVAAVGVVVPLLAGPASASTDLNGPFSTSGRWITDSQGRVFLTSGINMVYKRAPYLPSAIGFS
ncbi:MAG TPA: endoglycoceramidase, partial [Marmoricola sp.]|nr:endoglycoceramidase [Marmoricola sp.]